MRNDAIRQELQNTVTLLVERWGGVRTTALRPAFRILARGLPVRAAELAASSGRDIGEIEQALASAGENDGKVDDFV